MRSIISQLLALGPELTAILLASPYLSLPGVSASAASAPDPNLDFSHIGQVAVAGNFDSISLYQNDGQTGSLSSATGGQTLFTQYSNGNFDALSEADGNIVDMCPFVMRDNSLAGVVLCGNFTSIGGTRANSIALFSPNSSTPVQPLPGLSGNCNALYCDQTSNMVYVGGNFMGGNSTNALAWTTEWVNLPFAGFNGPVYSITKNAAGNIVFAGQFDGLGNATEPKVQNQQVINLGGGDISASGTTTTSGFSTASNIICNNGTQTGSGNTWLLADNTAGWWEAQLGYGFIPTKLRLYNANVDGRGAKTFYFEDLNSGGILNLTYQDANGIAQSCIQECPLANNGTGQDFYFSPTVGMSMFRIYITSWYGSGGGLSGIEMFQNDIYSFAVNAYNEPQCRDISQGSASVVSPASGTWQTIPMPTDPDTADSGYLMSNLTSASQVSSDTSVVFRPDIKQSGNYSITVWTPGCIQDNSCSSRGQVNITGTVSPTGPPIAATLYQTNNYRKYDQVYYGYVDVTSSFQPSVTLTPVAGQQVPLTVVAQKVRFELVSTTGGLNGLFEYNPNQVTISTDFSNSTIDAAGAHLDSVATVNSVINYEGSIYAAGSFSGNGIHNVMRINGNATSLPGGGLNGAVLHGFENSSSATVYYGGAFTETLDGSVTGLNHIAAYSLSQGTWSAVGAGVNGNVTHIVPITLNVSATEQADCITFTGSFTSVNAFNGNASSSVDGFAVWVPSKNNWLHNLPNVTTVIAGELTAFTTVPNSEPFWAGDLTMRSLGIADAVQLIDSGSAFQPFGVQLNSTSPSSANQKRDGSITSSANYTGVYQGLYYNSNNLNIVALAGSFSATASNGSTVENLVFINNTASQQTITGVSSLSSDSVFHAIDTQGTLLFAGGSIGGSVNGRDVSGLVVFDLASNTFASPQPPSISGGSSTVNAIRAQPSSSNVWVGGNFDYAGSLPCESLCTYSTSSQSWSTPGSGLSGPIYAMAWSSNTELIFAGNLTISGNKTSVGKYDTKSQSFQALSGASSLPGPVLVMSPVLSGGDFWVSGIATNNNSAYLSKYSGGVFTAASGLDAASAVRGLQVMDLTSAHGSTTLVGDTESLLISGNIPLSRSLNASAVLFNGTTYEPYILTSSLDGSSSSIAGIFVSNPSGFQSHSSHHLALGLVVLIGLAIALGLIFLIVIAGILIERHRRRNEGYVPMGPSRDANLSRIPPSSLLARLGEKDPPPRI